MLSLVTTASNEMKWCAAAMQMFALFSMYKLIVGDFNEINYTVMMLALFLSDKKNRTTQIALLVILTWHSCVLTLPMPAKFPFLHYLVNSAISFCVFASLFAYTHYLMYQNTGKRFKRDWIICYINLKMQSSFRGSFLQVQLGIESESPVKVKD